MVGRVPLIWGLVLNQGKWHGVINLETKAVKQGVTFSVLIYDRRRKASQEPGRWGSQTALSLVKSDQKPPLLHVFSVNEDTHMCQFVLDQLRESGG